MKQPAVRNSSDSLPSSSFLPSHQTYCLVCISLHFPERSECTRWLAAHLDSCLLSCLPRDFEVQENETSKYLPGGEEAALRLGQPSNGHSARPPRCLTPSTAAWPPLPTPPQTFSSCVFLKVALPCLPLDSNCSFQFLGDLIPFLLP